MGNKQAEELIKDEAVSVWLSIGQLKASVINDYITRASKGGFKKINFLFGTATQVKFTVELY